MKNLEEKSDQEMKKKVSEEEQEEKKHEKEEREFEKQKDGTKKVELHDFYSFFTACDNNSGEEGIDTSNAQQASTDNENELTLGDGGGQ